MTTRSASASSLAQADRVGDDVEAGAQRGAECGKATGETARGAGAWQIGDSERVVEARLRVSVCDLLR